MDLIRPLSLSFSVIQHTKIPAKTLCLIIIMTMTNNKNKNSNFKIKNIMILYSKFPLDTLNLRLKKKGLYYRLLYHTDLFGIHTILLIVLANSFMP